MILITPRSVRTIRNSLAIAARIGFGSIEAVGIGEFLSTSMGGTAQFYPEEKIFRTWASPVRSTDNEAGALACIIQGKSGKLLAEVFGPHYARLLWTNENGIIVGRLDLGQFAEGRAA